MAKLTVKGVQALTKPGRYGDGGTLFLNVAPGGSKSWIQRVTIDGKRRDIGIGGFPVQPRECTREGMDSFLFAELQSPLATRYESLEGH